MIKKNKETIIVLSAHSDDFVIGAGGTIANYSLEGKKIIAIIFSYGESSHPWLKQSEVQKMRSKETLEAGKLLNCKTIFFDLREFKFKEDFQEKDLEKKFLSLLEQNKPSKIFTHSNEDPHPDHRSVHKITMDLYEKLTFKPEIYIYSVWNPVSFKTSYPVLYVNITKNFKVKLAALKSFRSQRIHVAYPFFLLIFRSIRDAFKVKGAKFTEKFYRIK